MDNEKLLAAIGLNIEEHDTLVRNQPLPTDNNTRKLLILKCL